MQIVIYLYDAMTALDAIGPYEVLAQLPVLAEYGAIPTEACYVQSDKIVTAAGVSAGIDMALELIAKIHGDDAAKLLQLGIEYDPSPPFDAGSPSKVPAAMVEAFRATFEAAMAQRANERGPLGE